MTFFADLICFGLAALIMLGLLGVMSAAILGGSLSVKRTSTGSDVANDVALWFYVGLIVVFILQTLLAGLEAKWSSLVIVVIMGLLAVAAAIGDLQPVKKTFTNSDVLTPIAFWLLIGLIVVIILRGLLLAAEVKWFGLVILGILGLLAVAAAIGASLPAKKRLTRSYVVKAPLEQLWMALSEKPNWESGFCPYEELPPKCGNRMWVQYYECCPWSTKATWEEVESDPPYKLVKRTPDGRCCVTYAVEPVDGGSRLTITDGRVLHPIERIIERNAPIHPDMPDEERRLRILVKHTIYPERVDLHDATLVRRDDRGL